MRTHQLTILCFSSLIALCTAQSSEQRKPDPTATPEPNTVKKTMTEGWSDVKVEVVRGNKDHRTLVKGRRAVYKLTDNEDRSTFIPVVAIVAPESGATWVGPEQDRYIESGGVILGIRTILGGTILWRQSLVKPSAPPRKGAELRELSADFERAVDGATLLSSTLSGEPARTTSLRRTIEYPWFFSNGAGSSQPGKPTIRGAEVSGGSVQLKLADQTGEHRATVWIDIKTRKVTKTVEGGVQTFPKS